MKSSIFVFPIKRNESKIGKPFIFPLLIYRRLEEELDDDFNKS